MTDDQIVDGDVCVVGASAGGVVAAVKAARLGLRTVLVSLNPNLGGVFPSLGAVETHYAGRRASLLQEIRDRIVAHYLNVYGPGSEQYEACLAPAPMVAFEPHVGERVVSDLAAEENIQVLLSHRPVSVDRQGRRISSVAFDSNMGAGRIEVQAGTFVDATYTGDLVGLCNIPFRIGRESRYEFGEPHAGRVFTRWVWGRFPADAAEGRLNLHAKSTTLGLFSGSSGEGDDNIMAYSYRLCLTDDPDNQVPPPVPVNYSRERYLGIVETPEVAQTKRYALHHRWLGKTLEDMVEFDHLFHGHQLPNRKRSWNATNFPGASKRYPGADWTERETIRQAHLDHAFGILHFLRTDPEVPTAIQTEARKWGLAADEFADNGNVPRQLYVREGRRVEGRATFTEHDAISVRNHGRPPIHPDSIAITDFPIDSLACTTERVPGSICDGQFFLQELSRPGQIQFGVLLPRDVDNLLAPGAGSVSHVAWGTVRQTPTFMHQCEAVAHAARLACDRGSEVADVSIPELQRRLVESGVMITFFNDVDMACAESWLAAVQYLGARGFFPTFNADAEQPLDSATAALWLRESAEIAAGRGDAERLAAGLHGICSGDVNRNAAGSNPVAGVTLSEFCALAGEHGLDLRSRRSQPGMLSRGAACELIYEALRQ